MLQNLDWTGILLQVASFAWELAGQMGSNLMDLSIEEGASSGVGGMGGLFTDGLCSNEMIENLLEMAGQEFWKNSLVGSFTDMAKLIAGFLCLLKFASKAYQFMTGEAQWKVLPLLRPFALLLVILNWGSFVHFLTIPSRQLTNTAFSVVKEKNIELGKLCTQRWETIDTLTARIYTKCAMNNQAGESLQDDEMMKSIMSWLSVEEYNDLSQKLIAGGSWMVKAAFWGFTLLVEKLGLLFLQISIMLILLMQTVFTSILYIIGPLSFGFSVIRVWEHSWTTWIARFISVTFYSVLLFVSLTVIFNVMGNAIQLEASTLNKLVEETTDPLADWSMLYEYAGAITGHSVLFIVCIMAACGVAMYVPGCTTWIIETGGTAQAATGVLGGVGSVTMGATRAVTGAGALMRGLGGAK